MSQTENKVLKNFVIDLNLEKIFPTFKEGQTQRFVTLSLTLLAISFFSIFAISPTISTILELRKQLDDNLLVDQQLQQKIADLSELEQKYAIVQDALPAIYAAIPQTPQVPLLFGQIQGIAMQNHITITHIQSASPLAPLPKNGSQEAYTFTIDADGTQDNILSFVEDLASFDRIVTFQQVTIEKADGLQHTTINGTAYYTISNL